MKKELIILSISVCAILASIPLWNSNLRVEASAVEHLKLTSDQRIDKAKQGYTDFDKNPKEKSEVLVSFGADVTKEEIKEMMPSSYEIISEFHYFKTDHGVVTGAYTQCQGKGFDEIQNDYFDDIYELIEAKINHMEKNILDAQKKIEVSSEYKSFETDSNEIDANAIEKNVDLNEIIEVPENTSSKDDELLLSIVEMKKTVDDLKKQKKSMDSGKFSIYGIRMISENGKLSELARNSKVKAVEVLHFDKNGIVTPILE